MPSILADLETPTSLFLKLAPLKPAPDALIIDTSGTPIDAVVDRLVREVEGRAGRAGA